MSTIDWLGMDGSRQLTLALLHFLWQGCAIAILYAVIERCLRRRASAAVRYTTGVAALVLMAVCLPATFWMLPSPAAESVGATHIEVAWVSDPARPQRERPVAEQVDQGPAPTVSSFSGDVADGMPVASLAATGDALALSSIRDRLAAALALVSPYASGLYVLGVLLMLLRVSLGLWGGRRLRQACTPIRGGAVFDAICRQARQLGMRVAPAVAYCERIAVPVVVGVFRPMILLPAALATGLTPVQLQAVLLHELAHVRRYDLAVNVLQRFIEAFLFFHPAVWWLSRRVSAERENACDDLAIRVHCGATQYADALLRVAELQAIAGRSLQAASLAATGTHQRELKRRLLRLLGQDDAPSVRLTPTGVVLSVLLTACFILAPIAWQSVAARAEEQSKEAACEVPPEGPSPVSADPAVDGRIEAALQVLRTYDLHHGGLAEQRIWTSAIRELIQIGTPAGPTLIRELDRTEREETLRALGFVLRGIGDRRAVPALIRAIPRAIQLSGGHGFHQSDDPELLEFMQQHDVSSIMQRHASTLTDERDQKPVDEEATRKNGTFLPAAQGNRKVFDYGSAYFEIMAALELMTGEPHDWTELWGVDDMGGNIERHIKRTMFLKYARRWADWWSESWRKYVKDEADAQLDLTQRSLERYRASIPAAPDRQARSEFPHSPCIARIERDYFIKAFDESTRSMRDLDTGRCPMPPRELVRSCQGHEPSQALLAWAKREEVNLITMKVAPPGSDKSYYAFKPLGMKVWRIENDLFNNLHKECREGRKLDFHTPWNGLLAQIDAKSGAFDDALTVSFLFITDRGTCGAIQIQPPMSWEPTRESSSPKGGVQFQFIYEVSKGKKLPKRDAPKPVSMSAEAFGKLSAAEQRALLVRVFERRIEHAKNIYFEEDVVLGVRGNLEEVGGRPNDFRRRLRGWRLGDSFRDDVEAFENVDSPTPSSHSSCANNAEERVARNIDFPKDGGPRAQVQYPISPTDDIGFARWLTHSPEPADSPNPVEYLFPYLLEHQKEFEITAPVAGNLVKLSFPWQPRWARQPGGKRVYLLDPMKGFLPVRCDSHYDDPPTAEHPMGRTENFAVEESRLVGDVWMPTKLTGYTANSPMTIANDTRVTVTKIECGTVKLSDLFIPFPEGTLVQSDILEGATYWVDAQGNASKVTFERGMWHEPPTGWSRRPPADPNDSWTSRILPADQKRLDAARKAVYEKGDAQKNLCETAIKAMRSSAPVEERVEAGLKVLRVYSLSMGRDSDEKSWAAVVRELIRMDKPAVPKLCEELDRTERDMTLRALGFVLRGIGDPRSIPALIRAIPRLLQPSSSDFGLMMKGDSKVAKFMQEYDNQNIGKPRGPATGSGYFSYGRPIREIMPALEMMTGQSHNWMELNFACLQGTAEQQRIQRMLFVRHAERWADWWAGNWQKYVANQAEAQLDQTRQSLAEWQKRLAKVPVASPRTEFPVGPNVKVEGGSTNWLIRSYDESPSEALLDLDTGRHPNPPQELSAKSPAGSPSAELLAWAEREGVDLINVKVKLPGDKTYYAFLPVGMKVWRIENSRADALQKELRQGKKLELPAAWQGPLAQVDPTTRAYDEKMTASYLFITKEGTCGLIQLRAPLGTGPYSGGGLHYEFVY